MDLAVKENRMLSQIESHLRRIHGLSAVFVAVIFILAGHETSFNLCAALWYGIAMFRSGCLSN